MVAHSFKLLNSDRSEIRSSAVSFAMTLLMLPPLLHGIASGVNTKYVARIMVNLCSRGWMRRGVMCSFTIGTAEMVWIFEVGGLGNT